MRKFSSLTRLPGLIGGLVAATLLAGCAATTGAKFGVDQPGHDGTLVSLLPVGYNNAVIQDAALGIRAGIEAAAELKGKPPPVSEESSVEDGRLKDLYTKAYGAAPSDPVVFLGPLLTKPTTTLAKLADKRRLLVFSEAGVDRPGLVYQFALSSADEARDIADKLASAGHHQVTVLHSGSDWGSNLAGKFSERFVSRARSKPSVSVATFKPGGALSQKAKELLGSPRPVVLFAQAEEARAVYPRIKAKMKESGAAGLPVIATSHVNTSGSDKVLNGLFFVDMPWVLDAARRPSFPPSGNRIPIQGDEARLFAMGFDAYLLGAQIGRGGESPHLDNGASGDGITFSKETGKLATRSLMLGRFKDGLIEPFRAEQVRGALKPSGAAPVVDASMNQAVKGVAPAPAGAVAENQAVEFRSLTSVRKAAIDNGPGAVPEAVEQPPQVGQGGFGQ